MKLQSDNGPSLALFKFTARFTWYCYGIKWRFERISLYYAEESKPSKVSKLSNVSKTSLLQRKQNIDQYRWNKRVQVKLLKKLSEHTVLSQIQKRERKTITKLTFSLSDDTSITILPWDSVSCLVMSSFPLLPQMI